MVGLNPIETTLTLTLTSVKAISEKSWPCLIWLKFIYLQTDQVMPPSPLGSCTLNFDVIDLPHSSFVPLYPKYFRASPKVDLVLTVWRPPPSKRCLFCTVYTNAAVF